MNQITITNISSATVTICSPDINFRRELRPGKTIPITKEQYDSLLFEPGFDSIVKGHYIKINGIEEEQSIEEDVYSADQIIKMYDTKDFTGFAKFLPTARDAEKDSVVKLAIEKRVTDNAFVALIKKYCGVDVISAINLQHQLET